MRRLLYLLTALVLAAFMGTSVLAAAQAELVRAFVHEGTLTVYVDLSGAEQPVTKAEAKIGNQSFPASQTMATVRQADAPVTYLLLVDCSTSMPAYGEEISAFAAALAEGSGENTRFTLATFGEAFAVAAEDLTAAELPEAVASLPYEARSTRLHSGIQGALDYLEAIPRQGGELRSMVIFTDAVEYDPTGETTYEETLQRVEDSDVMVHALGFGDDEASLESLFTLVEASGGSCFQAGDEETAAQAARTLAEETGDLFVISFSLGGYQTEGGETAVSVTFASNGELMARAERQVAFPAMEGEAPAEDVPPAADPPAETPETTPAPSGSGAEATGEKSFGWLPLAAGGVLLVVIVVVVVAVAAGRRKRRSAAMSQTPAPAAPSESSVPQEQPVVEEGIFLRLEVLEGQLTSGRTEFSLTDQLIVGRDALCDIAFDSQTISRRHARVFTANGAVYLEDLGSQNGTAVNGAVLHAANILRSGDEITMGDVRFRLKF